MAIIYEEYAGRVANASGVELLRINLEILLERVKSGETDKARQALSLLVDSLDDRYESAREIMPVYVFVNKLLLSGTPQSLEDAAEIVSIILEGWRKVTGEGYETPDVFAGFTYGKDGELSEFTSGERSFEA